MGYLDTVRKTKKELNQNPAPVEVTDGPIVAVLIDSTVIGAPVWFALDDGFKSGDDIPVFYASELPHLQKMSEAELRRRYEDKLALGGGWIRDRKTIQ